MYKADWVMQSAGAASVNSAVATLDSELSTINSQVNSLKGQWESTAADNYTQLQTEWNKAADAIKTALESFKGGLNKTAGISEGVETSNGQIFV